MTKGIEGWIEYRVYTQRFNEDERRQIGEHALAAALFCFMQEESQDGDETTHYEVRPAHYDDTSMQLHLWCMTAEPFGLMEEKMEIFGNVFEDSFDGKLAHKVKKARGSRELLQLTEA